VDEAVELLRRYLEAGAGGPPDDLVRRLLAEALERAAECDGLTPEWAPRADDPVLLRRLLGAVEAWGQTGPAADVPPPEVLRKFLEVELDQAFTRLLESLCSGWRGDGAVDSITRFTERHLARVVRKLVRTAPRLVNPGDQDWDSVLRSLVNSFWVVLLEDELARVRAFRGASRLEWRAYVGQLFRNHVVSTHRAATAKRRGGGRPTVDLAAITDHHDSMWSRTGSPESGAELLRMAGRLKQIAARGPGWREAVDVYVRSSAGESFGEISASGEPAMSPADARNAVRRVRRALRAMLEVGRPTEEGGPYEH